MFRHDFKLAHLSISSVCGFLRNTFGLYCHELFCFCPLFFFIQFLPRSIKKTAVYFINYLLIKEFDHFLKLAPPLFKKIAIYLN